MGTFNISDEQEEQNRNPDLDASTKFTDCINQVRTITGVQFVEIGDIKWAIMDTDEGKISSSGKVVVKQLEAVEPKLAEGHKTKARLILKKGKYHFLEDV